MTPGQTQLNTFQFSQRLKNWHYTKTQFDILLNVVKALKSDSMQKSVQYTFKSSKNLKKWHCKSVLCKVLY